jgi:hypothetical protein
MYNWAVRRGRYMRTMVQLTPSKEQKSCGLITWYNVCVQDWSDLVYPLMFVSVTLYLCLRTCVCDVIIVCLISTSISWNCLHSVYSCYVSCWLIMICRITYNLDDLYVEYHNLHVRVYMFWSVRCCTKTISKYLLSRPGVFVIHILCD